MDRTLRELERKARAGEPDARNRYRQRLRRLGLAEPLSVEERIRYELFDRFETVLRYDIVEEVLRVTDLDGKVVDDSNGDLDRVSTKPRYWPVELRVNDRRLAEVLGVGVFDSMVPASRIYLPSRHYLGELTPEEHGWNPDPDKTTLDWCSCGYCERIVAEIQVSAEIVVWTGLERRPNNEAVPGLFVFERQAYEAALVDPPL